MDVTITLQHGPIEVEIQAEEEEEYQGKLIEIADFLEENQNHFATLATPSSANEAIENTHQTPMDSGQ
jgi:hypothetical protein